MARPERSADAVRETRETGTPDPFPRGDPDAPSGPAESAAQADFVPSRKLDIRLLGYMAAAGAQPSVHALPSLMPEMATMWAHGQLASRFNPESILLRRVALTRGGWCVLQRARRLFLLNAERAVSAS